MEKSKKRLIQICFKTVVLVLFACIAWGCNSDARMTDSAGEALFSHKFSENGFKVMVGSWSGYAENVRVGCEFDSTYVALTAVDPEGRYFPEIKVLPVDYTDPESQIAAFLMDDLNSDYRSESAYPGMPLSKQVLAAYRSWLTKILTKRFFTRTIREPFSLFSVDDDLAISIFLKTDYLKETLNPIFLTVHGDSKEQIVKNKLSELFQSPFVRLPALPQQDGFTWDEFVFSTNSIKIAVYRPSTMPPLTEMRIVPKPERQRTFEMTAMSSVHMTLNRLKTKIEINPRDTASMDSLAIMYSTAGNYALAQRYYEQHLEVEPSNKQIKVALALAQHKLKKSDQAIALLQEILVEDPEYVFALHYLAEIHISMKNYDEAELRWQKIISLDPKSAFAEAAAKRIKEVIKKKQPTIASPTEQESDDPGFVPYDTPPEPIRGFSALNQQVKGSKCARTTVRVTVHVLVDHRGDILNARVIQSNPAGSYKCEDEALAAVKSVKWKPALQKGKPVKVWVAIPVLFENSEEATSESGSKTDQIQMNDISGSWVGTHHSNTTNQTTNVTYILTQSENTISGRYTNNESGGGYPVSGRLVGTKVTIKLTDGRYIMKLRGTLSGNTISGTLSSSSGQKGTFEITRR